MAWLVPFCSPPRPINRPIEYKPRRRRGTEHQDAAQAAAIAAAEHVAKTAQAAAGHVTDHLTADVSGNVSGNVSGDVVVSCRRLVSR
ncbi:MAG: hypothetical protein WBD38_03415 [Candidatus Dormiibacterota bacterium]